MASSIIGQLRVILGLDTAAFDKGLSDAEREMSRSTRKLEKFGQRVENIGKSISVGVTLPILAVGGAALGMAAKFESSMNRVQAATQASTRQFEAMRQQAIAFGKDNRFPATAAETADAMENLAKNGRSVEEILGGATEAVLMLSAASGGDLPASADLATDIMAQFGKTAGELPGLVDKISGAMVASKLDFDNYRLAIGQAGSVAGHMMDFDQFNAAIASTAAGFASGSDAGTSFKTFLQRLVPTSKEAEKAMHDLTLSFFDKGELKDIGDIAEELRQKIGKLSTEDQAKALKPIFGDDAIRTAIELMKQGREGVANFRKEIDKIKASEQAAALMKGWAGAALQVKKAFEAAAISLGDSGILSALTKVLTLVASTIGAFADLPQPIQLVIGTMLGLTATIGPMLILGGKAMTMWAGLATLLIGRVVPATVATTAATTAAGGAAGASAARFVLMRGAMAFLLTPWGLVIGAIAVAIGAIAMASETATERIERLSRAAGDSSGAFAAMVEQARQARLAQEALAEANKKNAKDTKDLTAETDRLTAAMTRLGVATQWKTLKAAQANLSDARQRYDQAKARSDKLDAQASRASMGNAGEAARGQAYAARVELKEAKDLLKDVTTATEEAARNMRDGLKPPQVAVAATPATGGGAPANDNDGKGSGGKGGGRTSGPTKEELAARREELRLQAELNAAQMRGDAGTVQRLQDQLDLKQQIKSYEDAGLTAVEAKKAAEADLAAVASARRVAAQRELADQKLSVDLDVARLAGDDEMALKLERQQELKDRILFFEQQLVDVTDQKLRLEQATTMAMEQQAKVDAARAAGRTKWLAQDEAQRQIDLMKARGDSEVAIRQAQRRFDIERRIEQLKAQGLTEGAAREKAETEDTEAEYARVQGEWRDTIKGAARAALDGDLKGFASNWWKDVAARGMEEGLNSISDFLFSLFRNAFGQGANALNASGGGGSGLFGSILGGIGAALGAGGNNLGGVSASSQSYLDGIASTLGTGNLQGFAQGTKGWMKPVGMAGVDRNVVAFRMSSNEEFAVRRKGEVGGPVGGGIAQIVPSPYFDVVVDGRASAVAQPIAASTTAANNRRQSKRASRRLGR